MSPSRTSPPPPSVRTTIFSNSSTASSRPLEIRDTTRQPGSSVGLAPTLPSDAWTFCDLMAETTSSDAMPCAAILFASSQIRIATLLSLTVELPTPGTRRIAGLTTPYA